MDIAEKTLQLKQDFDDVYEAGKKAEWNAFWDAYQDYGKREYYAFAFSNTTAYSPTWKIANWTEETFKPKYPIVPKSCGDVVFFGLEIENFKEHCEKNGIIIDLSQVDSFGNFYRGLKTTYVPDIRADNVTGSISSCFYMCDLLIESPDILNGELISSYYSLYYSCKAMTKIPRLWATSVTSYQSTFFECIKLVEIEQIEGEISVNIDFRYSPLNVDTTKRVIGHLKNYAGTSSEFTCTLMLSPQSKTALEALGATSPNGNLWTDYISDLGWVLK